MDLTESLQIEQELERQRQEFLQNEKKQALCFIEINAVAEVLWKGGVELSIDNLADYGNMFPNDVQAAIRWFEHSAPGGLPFKLNERKEAESKLDRLIAGLSWIANRKMRRVKDRVTPPLDRTVLGMQKVMQLTDLGRVEILELVAQNQAALLAQWDDFKPSWVDDDQAVKQFNNKHQHQDTKIKLIREAVEEIAKGRIGIVTAEMLENWNNGKIGLTKRQIDRLLTEHPKLRDLDKHRAVGRKYRETDAIREARYMQQMHSR